MCVSGRVYSRFVGKASCGAQNLARNQLSQQGVLLHSDWSASSEEPSRWEVEVPGGRRTSWTSGFTCITRTWWAKSHGVFSRLLYSQLCFCGTELRDPKLIKTLKTSAVKRSVNNIFFKPLWDLVTDRDSDYIGRVVRGVNLSFEYRGNGALSDDLSSKASISFCSTLQFTREVTDRFLKRMERKKKAGERSAEPGSFSHLCTAVQSRLESGCECLLESWRKGRTDSDSEVLKGFSNDTRLSNFDTSVRSDSSILMCCFVPSCSN